MKNFPHLLFAIVALCGALTSCQDDPEVAANSPTLTLGEPIDLRRTSVTLNGSLRSDDRTSVREYGFKVGTTSALGADAQTITMSEEPSGDFSSQVKELQVGTPYFYAAYVSNGKQTILSEVRAVTTLTKSGALISDVTWVDEITCTVRAKIEDDGGATTRIAGFCWDRYQNPTIYDNKVLVTPSDMSFSAVLPQLEFGTTYYVRAFVDSDLTGQGTSSISYSNQFIIYRDPTQIFIQIPNANFKAYLVTKFDTNKDGNISLTETAMVRQIDVSTDNITSLEGIEHFVNLEQLTCRPTNAFYGMLASLDVSKNTQLTELYCTRNRLTALDVSNTQLTRLDCFNNQLTTLDVSKNTQLTRLDCSVNQLIALDVSTNTQLTRLDCSLNQLTTLDVSKNTKLTYLSCSSNKLTTLDVSNMQLTYLECSNNQLTTLDVSNTQLTLLSCYNNQLTALDVSKNTQLTELYCDNNQLTVLDVSHNTQLTILDCSKNSSLSTVYVWQGFNTTSYPYFKKDAAAQYVVKQ